MLISRISLKSILQHGSQPLFASATRKYPIFFHFSWAESDDVEITLPAGYALDTPEAPASYADTGKVGCLNSR